MTSHGGDGDGDGDGDGTYNELSSSFVDLLKQCRSSGLHSPTTSCTATGSSMSKTNMSSSFTLSQLAILHQTLLSTAATTTTAAAASSSPAATAVLALIDSCSTEGNSAGNNVDHYDSFLREFLLKISFREGQEEEEEDATEEGGSGSKDVLRHLFFSSNGRIRSRHDASNGEAGTSSGMDDDEKLDDEQRLLAIQFLLYHFFGFSSSSSSWESSSWESSKVKRMTTGLTRFLVPYILMTKVDDWNDDDEEEEQQQREQQQEQELSGDHDNNEKGGGGEEDVAVVKPPSSRLSFALLELLPAMMDQIFLKISSSDNNTPSNLLSPMFRQLTFNQNDPMVGKVIVSLMRIMDGFTNNNPSAAAAAVSNDISDMLVEIYHGRIRSLIDEALCSGASAKPMSSQSSSSKIATITRRTNRTMAEIVSCVSQAFILPLLSPSSVDSSSSSSTILLSSLESDMHRPFLNDHWRHIMGDFHRLSSSADETTSERLSSQHMIVWTTILCPLWPMLVKRHMPTIGDVSTSQQEEEGCKPINEPLVWNLIYSCLCVGSGLDDDRSDEHLQQRDQRSNHIDVLSLIRRRGLYLLDAMVDQEATDKSLTSFPCSLWKDYVLCLDTFEMESDRHLVDQLWTSIFIDRLLSAVPEASMTSSISSDGIVHRDNKFELTADWLTLLLARMLLSEHDQVRKLSLYRFMSAIVGPDIDPNDCRSSTSSKRKQKKGRPQPKPENVSAIFVRLVKPSFIFNVFLPSWDKFASMRSYVIHFAAKKGSSDKMIQAPMEPLFDEMIAAYVRKIDKDEVISDSRRKAFWGGVWDTPVMSQLAIKTVVRFYRAIHRALLAKRSSVTTFSIPINDSDLDALYETFEMLYRDRAMVLSIRQDMLSFLATILDSAEIQKWSPMNVLRLVCVFSQNCFDTETNSWTPQNDPTLQQLSGWISKIPIDLQTVGATFAVAFVDGELPLTAGGGKHADGSYADHPNWDVANGLSLTERKLGWGVALFCALSGDNPRASIWPAIYKGMSKCDAVVMSDDHPKAGTVARATLLLENGCILQQISGHGNGDLLLDPKTGLSVPTPPKVDKMARSAVEFVIWQLRRLLSVKLYEESQTPMRTKVLISYDGLFRTLFVCQRSYPSSMAIEKLMLDLLESSTNNLTAVQEAEVTATTNIEVVLNTALLHASVTAVNFQSQGPSDNLGSSIMLCRILLKTRLDENPHEIIPSEWIQTSRSVIQMSVWGAISCILPSLVQSINYASNEDQAELSDLTETILLKAVDAVDLNVGLPLFKCILSCSQSMSIQRVDGTPKEGNFHEKQLGIIIPSLIRLFSDSDSSVESSYMLNEICSFLFSPALLRREYNQIQKNPDAPAHCHTAFQKLLAMGDNSRPHISNCVLLHIIPAWLDDSSDDNEAHGTRCSTAGLNAIPYLDEIVNLVLYKGKRMDEWVTKQSISRHHIDSKITIPRATPVTSVERAFGLVYLSKLPDTNRQHERVVESMNYVIEQLLIKTIPNEKHQTLMTGCADYCVVARAWQALCVMSRFVTVDVVAKACDACFLSLREACHTQLRYFVEAFCVATAVRYPDIFGPRLIDELSRVDLSIQAACSLIIISGQFLVGKYPLSYFHSPDLGERTSRHRQVLGATLPWLSSPQGFSRTIAQLTVHKLTPLCFKIEDLDACSVSDDFTFVKTMYRFLDANREMKRMRAKQQKFFDRSNVEEMCTPEGILSVAVDGAEEATPEHLIDVMKATLQSVYVEAHAGDLPSWKQLQNLQLEKLAQDSADDSSEETDKDKSDTLLIQRKIVPLDSLNLALENQRQQRLLNAVGTQKHPLIVCASLISKVPNLGGIARTCEIFAASTLVLGDKSLTKMDNFKALSVGAADWLDIEEVNEESLFPWLLQKKQEGYFVVGLEQTSSSVPLHKVKFPPLSQPVILLLGKEKEGIPVQLLSAVDQCFEIPQFGILRSLNVHVSGAIAIWEYVKQAGLDS